MVKTWLLEVGRDGHGSKKNRGKASVRVPWSKHGYLRLVGTVMDPKKQGKTTVRKRIILSMAHVLFRPKNGNVPTAALVRASICPCIQTYLLSAL